MISIEEHIRNLCKFPHRGTTTGYEHRAADYARDHLSSLGYTVEDDAFTAPDAALYRTFIFIIACEIVAMIVSYDGTGAAIFIAALPFVYLFCKFYLMLPVDTIIFPCGKSRNIIGKLENPDAKRKVILTAHLDTQLGGYLFEPGWVAWHKVFTLLTIVGAVGTLVFVLLRVYLGGGQWMTTAQVVFLLPMAPVLYLFIKAEYTGAYVQGASDNASGMGVILNLAEELKANPPKDLEVWIFATGAEESGLCGMHRFLKKGAGRSLDKKSTFFINHDNLGGGSLRYLTGEVLPFIRYTGEVFEAAEKVAREDEHDKVTPGFWDVPTDGMAPAIAGFSAVTIFAYDDQGHTPHYHHFSDTVDNLDFAIPESAGRFTMGIIRRLDGAGEK